MFNRKKFIKIGYGQIDTSKSTKFSLLSIVEEGFLYGAFQKVV